MKKYPFCPTEIEFIKKQQIDEVLLKIVDKNILIIVSETSAIRWGFHNLIDRLRKHNNVMWINRIHANPTQIDVIDSLKQIDNKKLDLIIAIGGGSAIDLAKTISAFYDAYALIPTLEQLTDSINEKCYQRKKQFIDIIAIPTTAGTGSELTQWATLWDVKRQEKYSVDHPALTPIKAFIVPELTLTLSKELTLSTGFDALAHAIEAYWSIRTSPLVQDIAYKSIEIILDYLKKVLVEPENLFFREKMCRASVLAALAFSQTRTTACHSISYPMTLHFNIPHGIAVASTLGEVSKRNKGKFVNDEELYQLFSRYGGIQKWIDSVSEGIYRLRLSNYNIEEEDIVILASKAFTNGRMSNNPVVFTEKEVKDILQSIYK